MTQSSGNSSDRDSENFAKQQTTTTTTTKTTLPLLVHSIGNDVLLNNFQIKKRSYRVLLNGQHFVWERLQPSKCGSKQQQQEQQLEPCAQAKELEQQLAHNCCNSYGSQSHVLHLDDIISVRRGDTKQATLRPSLTPLEQPELLGIQKPTARYLSINYAERLSKSKTDCNRWHIRRLTLYNADPYIVRQWQQQLHARLYGGSTARLRVRRLLVFINPYGGRKAGLQTYERHCKPLFQLADIDVTCITTQRPNQIRDILLTHDLSVYDAVCCVGGDGTVAEVINGLLFRTIRELGLDEQRPAYIPKPMLPVGVIPAGSTDTIAYSMHGTADVRTAAIHVLLGQRRGLDVCSVRNSQSLLRFCASVLSYGYLGDVAAQSEQYRWMGTKRYEYTGVKAFINNRGYEAELRLLLEEEDAQQQTEPLDSCTNAGGQSLQRASSACTVSDAAVCYANCQRCSFAAALHEQRALLFGNEEESNAEDNDAQPSANLRYDENVEQQQQQQQEVTAADVARAVHPQLCINAAVLQRPRPASINLHSAYSMGSSLNCSSPTPSITYRAQWKSIRGKFFMICGANITCACSRSPNGISRYSHLGDGYLDLILVRKTSLLNNVRFLLNTAIRDGDIRNLPFVEVYRTRKFNFRTLAAALSPDEGYSINGSCQPITEPSDATTTTNFSSWNCDGEVVTDLDITMSSHCQLINVFMRGPHSYSKPLKATARTPTTPASSSDNINCCCKT